MKGRWFKISYYRTQLETWLSHIKIKTERVLDLGGASNPVRNRLYSHDVQEWVFFDKGAEEAKVEYMPFDINLPLSQLEGYQVYERDDLPKDIGKSVFKFDAVFCLEVFEYVWNPVQAMNNIYNLMNSDSIAYISFPSIYPVHNPVEIDYLRYTKQAILKYLTMVGFTNIDIIPRISTEGRNVLSQFYSVEKMHPVKRSELPYDIGYLVSARKLIV